MKERKRKNKNEDGEEVKNKGKLVISNRYGYLKAMKEGEEEGEKEAETEKNRRPLATSI